MPGPRYPQVRYRSWAGRSVQNRFVRDVASEACADAIPRT